MSGNAEDLEEFLILLVAEIVIAARLISVTSGRKRVCEVEVGKPILAAHAAKIKPSKKKEQKSTMEHIFKREECPGYHKTRRGRNFSWNIDAFFFFCLDVLEYEGFGFTTLTLQCTGWKEKTFWNVEQWKRREKRDELTWMKHRELTSNSSVRWGSQCTTEAAGCHRDLKSWFFHIRIRVTNIFHIKSTNTTRRNDLRTHSNVAGCSCGPKNCCVCMWGGGLGEVEGGSGHQQESPTGSPGYKI